MMIKLASSIYSRLTGMLPRKTCRNGETLLLVPCCSVHTFGMRENLDIAFIDSSLTVLATHRSVPPARKLSNAQAAAVLERRSINTPWYQIGEQLTLS